jgi:hypothetical protein
MKIVKTRVQWSGYQIVNCLLYFEIFKIQGEHKVFPGLQTFITRKLRGI